MAHDLRIRKSPDFELAKFDLASGHIIPAVGLGTWKAHSQPLQDAVFNAIVKFGYRHVDTAAQYGNESEIGEALKAIMDAGIDRGELFVTSKIWCTEMAPEKVRTAFDRTRKNLQLKYLDLYLIHWPIHLKENASTPPNVDDVLNLDLEGVWREMEKLVKEGLVRDLGVCNFTVKKMESLLKIADIRPSVNQVEMHPGWRNDKLLEFCKSNNIHVTAYSPLASDSRDLANEEIVREIARKLEKTPEQVLLRWALQRGTSVIPKSTNLSRIKQNIELYDWAISEADFKTLSSLPNQRREVDGSDIFINPEGPLKNVEQLWDGEV